MRLQCTLRRRGIPPLHKRRRQAGTYSAVPVAQRYETAPKNNPVSASPLSTNNAISRYHLPTRACSLPIVIVIKNCTIRQANLRNEMTRSFHRSVFIFLSAFSFWLLLCHRLICAFGPYSPRIRPNNDWIVQSSKTFSYPKKKRNKKGLVKHMSQPTCPSVHHFFSAVSALSAFFFKINCFFSFSFWPVPA